MDGARLFVAVARAVRENCAYFIRRTRRIHYVVVQTHVRGGEERIENRFEYLDLGDFFRSSPRSTLHRFDYP